MSDAPLFWPACPWCGSHEERDEDADPPENAIGICGHCINVVILGKGCMLRRPSAEEQLRLFGDPQFRAMFVMAHGAKRQALDGRMH